MIFSSFISFIRRKTSQRYRFNIQYQGAKWNCLRDLADLGRYSIIVGLTRFYCPGARILDLGCGEGILLERYAPADYSLYLGIDFSEVAVEKAKHLVSSKATFAVADLNNLELSGAFDVIIYNESLNYLYDPVAAVSSVFSNCQPDTLFIISLVNHRGMEQENIWSQLSTILTLQEKTKISNSAGDSWTVCVYKRQ